MSMVLIISSKFYSNPKKLNLIDIHTPLRSSDEVLHILSNILGALQRGRQR